MTHHLLILLDASDRDIAALHLARTTALSTGAAITLALPHNGSVLGRLAPYADGEGLTLPDAAELYVVREAARMWDLGVLTEAVAWPSTDTAADLASYAERHDVDALLIVEETRTRAAWRRSLATRVAARSSVSVVTVAAEDVELDRFGPPAHVVAFLAGDRRLTPVA